MRHAGREHRWKSGLTSSKAYRAKLQVGAVEKKNAVTHVVIKLPRYDYDEIIDALEGEEDDAADSGGEDYELAG